MDLSLHFLPQVWEIRNSYFLNKVSDPLALTSPEICIILTLPFLLELDSSHEFLHFLYPISLSSVYIISIILSLSSLILSSIWPARFPMLSNAFFISFIEFVSSRISVWLFFRLPALVSEHFLNFLLRQHSNLCDHF